MAGDAPPGGGGGAGGVSIHLLLLTACLCFIAGFVDTVSFIGINGLFTAHVTGNWVLVGAVLAGAPGALTSRLLALPFFFSTVAFCSVFVRFYRARHPQLGGVRDGSGGSAMPLAGVLLPAEIVALGLMMTLALCARPITSDTTALSFCAGMAGVVAMGIQNACSKLLYSANLVATTVMTGNTTQLGTDIVEVLAFHWRCPALARAVRPKYEFADDVPPQNHSSASGAGDSAAAAKSGAVASAAPGILLLRVGSELGASPQSPAPLHPATIAPTPTAGHRDGPPAAAVVPSTPRTAEADAAAKKAYTAAMGRFRRGGTAISAFLSGALVGSFTIERLSFWCLFFPIAILCAVWRLVVLHPELVLSVPGPGTAGGAGNANGSSGAAGPAQPQPPKPAAALTPLAQPLTPTSPGPNPPALILSSARPVDSVHTPVLHSSARP